MYTGAMSHAPAPFYPEQNPMSGKSMAALGGGVGSFAGFLVGAVIGNRTKAGETGRLLWMVSLSIAGGAAGAALVVGEGGDRSGAALGASIGSVVPGLGGAIGAYVGTE